MIKIGTGIQYVLHCTRFSSWIIPFASLTLFAVDGHSVSFPVECFYANVPPGMTYYPLSGSGASAPRATLVLSGGNRTMSLSA